MKKTVALHPNQFVPNEAWIIFRLTDEPIHTDQDGSFHVVCLMDAASCFIFGNAFVPLGAAEPSELDVKRLFKSGWLHQKRYPKKLMLPKGQFKKALPAEAGRQNIAVVPVPERELLVFIGEAREGFREHVQGRHE